MVKLAVGGVPEHFNAPWMLSMGEGTIDVDWKQQDGGTGAMARALSTNELDVAVGSVSQITERHSNSFEYM